MNWGYKLAAVFIGFTVLIGTLVYKSVNTKLDLVSKDYYKDELRYQDQIDGRANAGKISAVSVTQNDTSVIIQLPKELNGITSEGEAWFYCKTNADLDKKIPLQVNSEGRQVIVKNQLAKQAYQLKLKWKTGNENYYSEQKVVVQ